MNKTVSNCPEFYKRQNQGIVLETNAGKDEWLFSKSSNKKLRKFLFENVMFQQRPAKQKQTGTVKIQKERTRSKDSGESASLICYVQSGCSNEEGSGLRRD